MSGDVPTLLQGRWRIVGLLARGGSARVFRGIDTQTDREVALKILDLADIEDWKQVELFERQLPLLRRLRHRGIPEVHDAFEHVHDGRTQLVLVQTLHDGPNLRDALAGDVRFDDRTARAFLGRMLDILEYLHGFSPPILHRDIKPANILLELPDGGDLADAQPILIDFDTARGLAIDPSVSDGTMVGSAGFVPIEQLAGRPMPASDLYALGMTMIAAVSRREVLDLPVERSRIAFRPFVNISDQLATVLERMIEPIVEDRFADVAAVRRALSASPATSRARSVRFSIARVLIAVGLIAPLVTGGAILMLRGRGAPPNAEVRADPPPSPAPSSRRVATPLTVCGASNPPCEALTTQGWHFGASVAISDTTLAIGTGSARGGVNIFTRDATSWTEQASLDSPHDEDRGQFGRTVALDGETLAVAARLAYKRSGAVFVYVRDGAGWRLQANLPGPRAESMFGEAIALSGDTLAVYETDRVDGTITLFARRESAWTTQQQLHFRHGVAFALDGDTLVVSAPRGTIDDPRPALHIYRRTDKDWTRESVLHTASPSADNVVLAGDSLLMPSRDPARPGIRIFTRERRTWAEQAIVELPRRQPARAAALSGDRMAVVSLLRKRTADGLELDHTEVSLFRKQGSRFHFERAIDATLVEDGRIALEGETLVLGADSITASNHDRDRWPGAAFVFSLGSQP